MAASRCLVATLGIVGFHTEQFGRTVGLYIRGVRAINVMLSGTRNRSALAYGLGDRWRTSA